MKYWYYSIAAILFFRPFCPVARGEGYGSTDFMGSGHTLLRAVAQKDTSATNYIAVGRTWTGSQYQGIIASYRVENGGHDLNFALANGYWGRMLFDFAGAGYDNLCNAVTYADTGFIAACRSMKASGYPPPGRLGEMR